MDEGEGLGLKMELYKANGNGSHTVVRGPPLGLYMTPEGPLAKHEIFHLTIFHHKMWGWCWGGGTSHHIGCTLCCKAFINLPVGVQDNVISGESLWPP